MACITSRLRRARANGEGTSPDQGGPAEKARIGRRWCRAVRLLDRHPHRSRGGGARLPPHPPRALHHLQLHLCLDRRRAGLSERPLATGRHRALHPLRRALELGRLVGSGRGGGGLGGSDRSRHRRPPGCGRHRRRLDRGAFRRLSRPPGADRADLGPLVEGDSCHPVPVAGRRRHTQHRLLGRREQTAPPRRLPVPAGSPGEGAGHGVHPRRRLDDRREARAGKADDVRARRPGLGLRGHQLPAEPEGNLAGSHRRRQARRVLGQGAHRRVRRRCFFRSGQRWIGGRTSVRPARPDRGRPRRSNRVSSRPTRPCRRLSPSTASWT